MSDVTEGQDEENLDTGTETGDEEQQPKGPTPEEAAKVLQDRLDAALQRAANAESALAQRDGEVVKTQKELHESNLATVTSAIDTIKRENGLLRSEFTRLMSAGEYDEAAKINEQVSINAARLVQLENGKAAMETAPVPTPAAPPQRSFDPVEEFCKQVSPKSADWVRAHPEFVTDRRKYDCMIAAHVMTMNKPGMVGDTDAYFESVESILRSQNLLADAAARPSASQPLSSAADTQQRRNGADRSPPAAPANDGAGAGSGAARLTKAQREAAEASGLSEKDYYENVVALKKEGRLN